MTVYQLLSSSSNAGVVVPSLLSTPRLVICYLRRSKANNNIWERVRNSPRIFRRNLESTSAGLDVQVSTEVESLSYVRKCMGTSIGS